MDIEIPKAFKFLTEEHRLKVIYGGRGGAKSESVGRYLLLSGMEKTRKIVCAREFQNSIKDSVHDMLSGLINMYDLGKFYEVFKTEIRGKNGTTFSFVGLQRNIANIKSMYDVDKFWVEEAETVSDHSWKVIFPTIRAEGSEIIATFNPDIEESPTYQRLVVNAPDFAFVKKVSYRDNPYFPKVLEQERKHMLKTDPDSYDNVWEGNCKAAVEGAVFAKELQRVQEEGRITIVPYDETVTVNAYLDLGFSDQTAIWFEQTIGFQYRFLRYYQNSQEKVHHYIKYMKELPYVYGTIYLPHDAENEALGQDRTVANQFREAFKNVDVIVVPRTKRKHNAIEAARSILPASYFDKEKCADGIMCLRRYAFATDAETGKIGKNPEHNIWSHGADAYQCAGQAIETPSRDTHPHPGYTYHGNIERSEDFFDD